MSDFLYRQLAKSAQLEKVTCGQNISLKVDLALAHDGTGPDVLDKIEADSLSFANDCRVVFTLDHSFPAPTVKDREFQRKIAGYADRNDSITLYKNAEGVLHQVVAEEESLWPGMIIVGADGHVATAGALSAIAFSVSPSDFARVVSCGSYQVAVPEQIIIAIEGGGPQVMARDIAMHLMHSCADKIKQKAVVLTGPAVDRLNMSEKMSLCNFLPEGGVVTALVLPEGERKNVDITIDAADIRPMLAVPGKETGFVYPYELQGKKISVAIAGGCSSGRLNDMRVVSDILSNRDVHPDVTFIITPGSRSVLECMDKLKISSVLRKAGAIIMPPGCGPCPGKHFGVLCDTDVAVTTTIRNNPGRIGAKGATVYLASPATVALAAVEGRIVDPLNRQ